MDQMTKLEELNKRMDRIKEVMDVTGMCMEELIAESAMVHIDCGMCPIKTACDKYRYGESYGCSETWTMYLKGEIDGKET